MRVVFIPAYFSRTCFCNIPAHWRAECDATGRYGDGETREEAIATLRANGGRV